LFPPQGKIILQIQLTDLYWKSFDISTRDNIWVTLWLVTWMTISITMLKVYKTTKNSCEIKRKKPDVTLWLANITDHNVNQVLPPPPYKLQYRIKNQNLGLSLDTNTKNEKMFNYSLRRM